MSTPIRVFNEQGVAAFQALLQQYREGYVGPVPQDLLLSNATSTVASPATTIEPQLFNTKGDAACALVPRVQRLRLPNLYQHRGLWAWLSAYYFDSVCPPREDGTRNVGAEYRYMFVREGVAARLQYRALLAMPCAVYARHGNHPKIIMDQKLPSSPGYINDLVARQDIIRNASVLQAADILFWDAARRRPRVGISSAPGNVERFVAVIAQLDLTYDLYSMSGEEIVALLPTREFGHWLAASPA